MLLIKKLVFPSLPLKQPAQSGEGCSVSCRIPDTTTRAAGRMREWTGGPTSPALCPTQKLRSSSALFFLKLWNKAQCCSDGCSYSFRSVTRKINLSSPGGNYPVSHHSTMGDRIAASGVWNFDHLMPHWSDRFLIFLPRLCEEVLYCYCW